jgi:hypothetical protein
VYRTSATEDLAELAPVSVLRVLTVDAAPGSITTYVLKADR